METNKLEFMTVTYRISGDLLNGGGWVDGKFIPCIEKETIHRRIKRIDPEKGVLVCECDRRFLLNENLSVTEKITRL
jgi:hypothetical protein